MIPLLLVVEEGLSANLYKYSTLKVSVLISNSQLPTGKDGKF